MKNTFFYIFVFCCIYNYSIAQNWNSSYCPRYRHIKDLHIHSPEKISIVGGHPFNDSITYMAYSSFAGQSWDIFTDIFPGKMINTVLLKNNITGYCAGYNEAFYKTSDGGKNWSAFDIGIDLNNKNINKLFKSEYGVLFAAGGLNAQNGFLLKSTDGGNSWLSIYDWPSNEIITAASPKHNNIVVAGTNGFLQFSTDGAASWQNCDYPNIAILPEFTGVNFFNDNIGFCCGGVRGQDSTAVILKTTDGGSTWSISLNIIAPCLNDICMASEQVIYAVGDYGAVLKSDDGGITWNEENIDGNPGEDLFTVSFLNTHIGAIAGRFGYVMVFNDGQTDLPEITTSEARDVTKNTAVLNAIINPGFSDSEVSFLYGIDENTENEIDCGTFYGGDLQTIQKSVNNLEPDTKYYFRAKLTNNYGEYLGAVKYFYTGNPIPNWDFELWTEISKDFPENWYVNEARCEKISYDGFEAIKLQGTSGTGDQDDVAVIMNTIIDGDGIINEWHIPVDFITDGLPISSRPDSLYIKLKYDVETNDSAVIFIGLILDEHYVAESYFFLTGAQQNFETTGFKIEYLTEETPERAVIAIISSNPFDTLNNYSSYIEISEIYFANKTPEIPNSDFSKWINRTTYLPQDWHVDIRQVFDNEGTIQNFSERVTDAAHNDYAIKLQNKISESDTTIARLSLRDWNQGIPIDKRFNNLMGYIKYIPEASDTASITIVMYEAGEPIAWGGYRTSETILNWTEFIIELNYFNSFATPDSMNIIIEASQTPTTGESQLYIDKLSLDGDYIPVEEELFESFRLYPNPVNDILTVLVENHSRTSKCRVKIVDINGKIQYNCINTLIDSMVIDVSFLRKGFYLIQIDTDNSTIIKRFIKV